MFKSEIYDDCIICKICGKSYESLPKHIVKTHGMEVEEYKKEFGYNRNQGLECKNLTRLRRENNLIKQNK